MCSLYFKNQFELWKTNNSKQRKIRLGLSCSKKVICITLREITSKHKGYFYYLKCLHSFRTENKLKSHEKLCKNKVLGGIVIPLEKDSILEFNQHMKSDKIWYIIYANIESLIKKIDGCANNLEKTCGYSIQKFGHLIISKTNIFYIVGKIVWKSFVNL